MGTRQNPRRAVVRPTVKTEFANINVDTRPSTPGANVYNQLMRFPNAVNLDNEGDSYMFYLLDTLHDIFDRLNEFTPAERTILIKANMLADGTRMSIWGKIDHMLSNVYNLNEETLFWKRNLNGSLSQRVFESNAPPKIIYRNNRTHLDGPLVRVNKFTARSFVEYWSYKTLGYYFNPSSAGVFLRNEIEHLGGIQKAIGLLVSEGNLDPDEATEDKLNAFMASTNRRTAKNEIVNAMRLAFNIVEFQTLGQIKHALIEAVFQNSMKSQFDFHPQVGQPNAMVNLLSKETTKSTKVIETIFKQYDRLLCAVDATKGSLKNTRLALTPAQLLDPSHTPVTGEVNFILAYFQVSKHGQEDTKDEFLEISFDERMVANKQLTCTFHMKMYVMKVYPATTRAVEAANKINSMIYDKLAPYASTNGVKLHHILKDLSMPVVQASVAVAAYSRTGGTASGQRAGATALVLHSSVSKSVIRPVVEKGILRSHIERSTQSNRVLIKPTFSGMSVSECLQEIRASLTPKNNRASQRAVQYYLDWKRMGDSFQVSYLEAVNKATILQNASQNHNTQYYIYFATQDILAICQAIGFGHTKRPLDKLSFIYNTNGSTNWMMGTNILHKEHMMYMSMKVSNIKAMQKARNKENRRLNAAQTIQSYLANSADKVNDLYTNIDRFDLSNAEKKKLASYLTNCAAIESCRLITNMNSENNNNNNNRRNRRIARPSSKNPRLLEREYYDNMNDSR
jgi:hypothetical protein